jgi:predicted sulfurtransferase
MKKFLWQSAVIVGLSLIVGLAYNQFSRTPLPLFEKYDPHRVEIAITVESSKASENTEIPRFQEIDAETIQSLMESETAILLDARRPVEFRLGHIHGAVSLPICVFNETYPDVAPLLNEGRIIITYCEGIHCTDSSMLAMELQKKGHQDIFVYKGGMENWLGLGNPVETFEEASN